MLYAKKMTGFIGAEVDGVDLATLKHTDSVGIKEALLQHSVLVFRDQNISPAKHLEIARLFGQPEPHPIVAGRKDFPDILEWTKGAGSPTDFGESWHTDNSYQVCPTGESLLLGVDIPPSGNDTLFSSTYCVYDGLSDGMKKLLENLVAVHCASKAFNLNTTAMKERFEGEEADRSYNTESNDLLAQREHSVVRIHPHTGRKIIYVNSMFTTHFKGMTVSESESILSYLWKQVERPEFQCRVRWEPWTFVIWDNRCTQHMALNDNFEHSRTMRRVTVKGEAPRGPSTTNTNDQVL